MAEHYYTTQPTSEHKPLTVSYQYKGATLTFSTDKGVFSRTEIDRGTDILLQALPELQGNIADIGSGYGVIGICIAKTMNVQSVTMVDVNERAVSLCKQNSKDNHVNTRVIHGDGCTVLTEKFHHIITNPPIRAGKTIIYTLFAQAKAHLEENGVLWLVIRKQQGAASAKTYLTTLFAQVEVVKKEAGFWVLRCQ